LRHAGRDRAGLKASEDEFRRGTRCAGIVDKRLPQRSIAKQNRLMSLPTSIAIYFIIWWVVLFAVLPWGVRSQQEHGAIVPGSDPGAPAIPRLKRKLVWTTIVAGVVFALWYVVYTYRLIALDDLAALLGVMPR
jgi:predicted secreted protein